MFMQSRSILKKDTVLQYLILEMGNRGLKKLSDRSEAPEFRVPEPKL